jgi:hypothetical protein
MATNSALALDIQDGIYKKTCTTLAMTREQEGDRVAKEARDYEHNREIASQKKLAMTESNSVHPNSSANANMGERSGWRQAPAVQ